MEERKLAQKLYDEFILWIHPQCTNELEQLTKCKDYCKKHISFELMELYDEDMEIKVGDYEYNACMEKIHFYIEKIVEINNEINDWLIDDLEG